MVPDDPLLKVTGGTENCVGGIAYIFMTGIAETGKTYI